KHGTRYPTISLSPPLGLLYIAAYLRDNGVEVRLVDQNGERASDEEVLRRIERFSPKVLGFSTMAWQASKAGSLAAEAKTRLPDSHIVMGGIHATLNPLRMMKKYPQIDSIIAGEGELSVLKLLKALELDEDLKTVPGIYYRENGRIKAGAARHFITDLDSLPFPARDLVRQDWYGQVEGMDFPNLTTVVSSRGCPHSCSFCCCSSFSGRRWRARSPENVVDEIEELLAAGYKTIFFVDDNFTMNRKRIHKICHIIRERRLEFDWLCEGRVDQTNYDTIRNMVGSGCKTFYLGLESANQRMLDLYKKKITPRMSEQAVTTARRAGVDVILATFIIGGPGETAKEIQNTINFALKLDIDFPQFNTLVANTRTEIWNQLVAQGLIDSDEMWDTGVFVSDIYPGNIPTEKLMRLVADGYDRFLHRVGFVFKQLYRITTSRFRMRMLLHNIRNRHMLMKYAKGELSSEQ
ncbi:MAG: B12-binding domain-containing radical SAM protein, partial [Candidatus Thorarchaeota archaeon]